MTTDTSILCQSATELARQIQGKTLSSRECTEAFLAQIRRHGRDLNAIVTLDEQGARARAQDADDAVQRGDALGPLHGVPMTVKDVWDTAGLRTTNGLPRPAWRVPSQDAPVIAALRNAGANIVGKSSLPLMSYDWQSDHPTQGRVNNPWDLGRTPGGSSGGAAASIAAGFTSIEVGSDIAGSIRVPCHYTGIFGLRPTEGAIDGTGSLNIPGTPHRHFHLVTGGPMARHPGDLSVVLEVIRDPNGPVAARGPVTVPARPRLAVCGGFPGAPPCADTTRVFESTWKKLADEGWQVEEASPAEVSLDEAFEIWGLIHGHEFVAAMPGLMRTTVVRRGVLPRVHRAIFGDGTFTRVTGRGAISTESSYQVALERRVALMNSVDRFFDGFDAWLTPTSATVAFPHTPTGSNVYVDGNPVAYSVPNGIYNCATAAMGHPVVAVPVALSSNALPIGLQLHGRRGTDFALIALAERMSSIVGTPPRAPQLR